MLRPEDLAELAQWLRERDLPVSAQQLIAAARLLTRQRVPSEEAELGAWLAPVFCTRAADQARFDELYRSWLSQHRHHASAPPPPPFEEKRAAIAASVLARWTLPVAVVLLLCFIVGLAWLSSSQSVAITVLGNDLQGREVPVTGATVQLLSSGSQVLTDSHGRASLTARRWRLNSSVQAWHGDYAFQGKLQLAKQPLSLQSREAVLRLKREIPEPPPPPPPTTLGRRVDVIAAPATVMVPDTAKPPQRMVDPYAAMMLATSIAVVIGWWAYTQLRRRGFLERLPARDDDKRWQVDPTLAPPLSGLAMDARALGLELRRRRHVPSRLLDIPATVAATVRRGGQVAPVFGMRAEPDYLILVECQAPRDHQTRLADEVIRQLAAQGVALDRYEFDGDPSLVTPAPLQTKPLHLGTLSLAALYTRHPEARLLIFGDARCLLDRYTGQLAGWLPELSRWTSVAVLTPLPRADWGLREALVIGSGIQLQSLDAQGLHSLADYFRQGQTALVLPDAVSKTRRAPAYLRDAWPLLQRRAPPRDEQAATLDALTRELKATGVAWLAGCAVYPELHWPITLVVGTSLTPVGISDPREREQLLARLCRLPWLRRSYMPDWFREVLLKQLDRDEELLIRRHIAGFLDTATRIARGNSTQAMRIAIEAPGRAWRDVLQGLRVVLRREPPREVQEDHVFLRFMSGPRSRLAFAPGNLLRALLYRHGASLAGPSPFALLLAAALCSAMAWRWPPIVKFDSSRPARVVQPAPSIIALDNAATSLAIADSEGGVALLQTAKLGQPFTKQCALLGQARVFSLGFDNKGTLKLASRATESADAFFPDGSCIGQVQKSALAVASDFVLTDAAAEPILLWTTQPIEAERMVKTPWKCSAAFDGRGLLIDEKIAKRLLQGSDEALACAASPDGRRFAVMSQSGAVRQFALDTDATGRAGLPAPSLRTASRPTALAVSDDGRTLAATTDDGSVWIWKNGFSDWQAMGSIEARAPLTLSGDGMTLAVADVRQETQLWRLQEALAVGVALFIDDGASPTAINVDAQATTMLADTLSAAYGYTVIRIGNPDTGQLISKLKELGKRNPQDPLLIYLTGRISSANVELLSDSSVKTAIRTLPARDVLVIYDTTDDLGDIYDMKKSRAGPPGTKSRHLLAMAAEDRLGTALLIRALLSASAPMSGKTLSQRIQTLWPAGAPDPAKGVGYVSVIEVGHSSGDIVFTPKALQSATAAELAAQVDRWLAANRSSGVPAKPLPPPNNPPPAKPWYDPFVANIFFDFEKVSLKSESRAELDELVENIRRIKVQAIFAVGHSDSQESPRRAREISVRRAQAVKDYLVLKGIDANLIYVEGKGTDHPVSDTTTAKGRAGNRVVEVEVTRARTVN